MRTTLNIDDDLYRQVKAAAALRGCSVTSMVEESLREVLAKHGRSAEVRPLRVLPESGGVRSGIDLSDGRALRHVMDDGRALDAVR